MALHLFRRLLGDRGDGLLGAVELPEDVALRHLEALRQAALRCQLLASHNGLEGHKEGLL